MRGLLVMAMFTASLAGAGAAGVPHSPTGTELVPDPNIESHLSSREAPRAESPARGELPHRSG